MFAACLLDPRSLNRVPDRACSFDGRSIRHRNRYLDYSVATKKKRQQQNKQIDKTGLPSKRGLKASMYAQSANSESAS